MIIHGINVIIHKSVWWCVLIQYFVKLKYTSLIFCYKMNRDNERQFCVVEFIEEQDSEGICSMAIVTEKWIKYSDDNNKVCVWPTYIKNDSRRRKMIMEHIEPDSSRCDICPINIKYKTGNYQKAVDKMKQLEEFSDIQSQESQTENEERVRKNRSRTKAFEDYKRYGCPDSEDDLFIPATPKIPFKSKVTNIKKTDLNLFQTSVARHTAAEISSDSSVSTLSTMSHNSAEYKTSACSSCGKNDALLKKMFSSIHSMENDLKYIIRMLQSNNNMMSQDDSEYIKNLPADDVIELEEFNKALEKDQFFSVVVNTLQTVGGRDVVDGCRRLMCKIMTNQLALTFNWLGRNNKKGFTDLQNIIKLIIAVLRRNPLCRNSTQAEVENVIKKWLRNAADRDGGRTRRGRKDETVLERKE